MSVGGHHGHAVPTEGGYPSVIIGYQHPVFAGVSRQQHAAFVNEAALDAPFPAPERIFPVQEFSILVEEGIFLVPEFSLLVRGSVFPVQEFPFPVQERIFPMQEPPVLAQERTIPV